MKFSIILSNKMYKKKKNALTSLRVYGIKYLNQVLLRSYGHIFVSYAILWSRYSPMHERCVIFHV